MTTALRQIPAQALDLATFKEAMRHIVGGVSVITAGAGEARTGLTVTTALSLSVDPPTMLVCVNRNASAWPIIQRERHYCVSILDARHQEIADRFAGRGGVTGSAAMKASDGVSSLPAPRAWRTPLPLLIAPSRKSSNAIAMGSSSVQLGGGAEALVYGHGRYRAFSLA
jgi:3-hydroxy-9,10-secoandrosta-1,3,5(10)-triene-9,17-dione monooxygenase reductase component